MSETSKRFPVSPASYATLYPELVAVAKNHGYALAIHGSMTRDFDLIAIPWIPQASAPLELARSLKEKAGGCFHHPDHDDLLKEDQIIRSDKPQGRLTCSIHLTAKGAYGPYIDLSIIPRTEQKCPDCGGKGKIEGVSKDTQQAPSGSIYITPPQ